MIDRKLLDALTDAKRRLETAAANVRAADKVADDARSAQVEAYRAYEAAKDAVIEAA